MDDLDRNDEEHGCNIKHANAYWVFTKRSHEEVEPFMAEGHKVLRCSEG